MTFAIRAVAIFTHLMLGQRVFAFRVKHDMLDIPMPTEEGLVEEIDPEALAEEHVTLHPHLSEKAKDSPRQPKLPPRETNSVSHWDKPLRPEALEILDPAGAGISGEKAKLVAQLERERDRVAKYESELAATVKVLRQGAAGDEASDAKDDLMTQPKAKAMTATRGEGAPAAIVVPKSIDCGQVVDKNKKEKCQLFLWTAKFHEFGIQCSHNTYLSGRQVALDVVHAKTMSLALDLGYRCLELDIYGSQVLVVQHMAGPVPVTNKVALQLFLSEILKWLKADEEGNPDVNFRLPLVLSIENHVQSEAELFEAFNGAFGDRIVKSSDFLDTKPMSSYVAARRKIILKSKIKEPGSKLIPIVAMVGLPKGKEKGTAEPVLHQYKSQSVEVGSLTKFGLTPEETEKITKAQAANALIRTYPTPWSASSINPSIEVPIALGVQMVCVNVQGFCGQGLKCDGFDVQPVRPGSKCRSTRSLCPCKCQRDVAEQLETVFDKYGLDGYMPLRTMQSPLVLQLLRSSVYRPSDEETSD